jgi:hypothetical protein
VMVYFDFSNFTLVLLCCLLIVPYWCVLGTLAGLMRWNDYGDLRDQGLSVIFDQQLIKQIRWYIDGMALFMAVIFFFASGPLGSREWSYNFKPSGYIINNLRQIDAAKQQFALETQKPGNYVPTEADLTVYIRVVDGKLPSVATERYVLNAITNPPYAILTNDWRFPRRGWREGGIVATNGTIYRLP